LTPLPVSLFCLPTIWTLADRACSFVFFAHFSFCIGRLTFSVSISFASRRSQSRLWRWNDTKILRSAQLSYLGIEDASPPLFPPVTCPPSFLFSHLPLARDCAIDIGVIVLSRPDRRSHRRPPLSQCSGQELFFLFPFFDCSRRRNVFRAFISVGDLHQGVLFFSLPRAGLFSLNFFFLNLAYYVPPPPLSKSFAGAPQKRWQVLYFGPPLNHNLKSFFPPLCPPHHLHKTTAGMPTL